MFFTGTSTTVGECRSSRLVMTTGVPTVVVPTADKVKVDLIREMVGVFSTPRTIM